MISKHISYKEGVYSNTATRRGIDNTPTDDHLHFMEIIAEEVFEPLRTWVGGPIKINSTSLIIKNTIASLSVPGQPTPKPKVYSITLKLK